MTVNQGSWPDVLTIDRVVSPGVYRPLALSAYSRKIPRIPGVKLTGASGAESETKAAVVLARAIPSADPTESATVSPPLAAWGNVFRDMHPETAMARIHAIKPEMVAECFVFMRTLFK